METSVLNDRGSQETRGRKSSDLAILMTADCESVAYTENTAVNRLTGGSKIHKGPTFMLLACQPGLTLAGNVLWCN